MKYIYNEPLQWIIDGINKEFATINPISNIEEVYLWWASYRAVSFSGNTVLFQSAPPLWVESPTIDYFYDDWAIPEPTGELTLWDITNEVYDIIWTERTSKIYKLSTVINWISKLLIKIDNMKVFQPRRRYYSFNKSWTVSAIWYNAWYVEIWVDKKYIPSSWAIIIWWASNPIIYNWYIDGKLTCIPWIEYKSWSKVEILYKLPSISKSIIDIHIDWEPVKYQVYTLNWDNYAYIEDNREWIVNITYQPISTKLEEDTDVIDFPYEYSTVVALWVAYNLLQNREDDRALQLKREYQEELRKYKWYKSRSWARTRITTTSLTWI